MHKSILFAGLCAVFAAIAAKPAQAQSAGDYQVSGLSGEELLKMRKGPGTGYRIVIGLPAGSKLYVYSCEQAGHTSWCKVSLKGAPALKGYVSSAYLSAE